MRAYDALIVGGGPAGTSCAWQLRRGGMSVLLLDKADFPRDKPCAGWITPQVFADLDIDIQQYGQGRICQPIYGFRSGLIGGSAVEVGYTRPVSYGIRRREFDAYLLDRSGAESELGKAVKNIERRAGQWIINSQYSAPLLVGAGGHFCPVARSVGARRTATASVVTAQEIEFAATDEQLSESALESHVPELYFCSDLKGYGWCFRKDRFVNIGLGRLDNRQLTQHVRRFCDYLRESRRICGPIPEGFVGHAYQVYERVQPRLLDDSLLLVGDAAGLAYPQSGEGIRPAVESGLIAADVILSANGCYTQQQLLPYQEQIIQRFGSPRARHQAEWPPDSWQYHIATRLLATKWFVKHVVMQRWFLHSHQSPLSHSGLRSWAQC